MLLEPAEAIRTARTIRDLQWDPPTDAYHAASAIGVGAAAGHQRIDAKRREEAARLYADEAMALMREAVKRGFTDLAMLGEDPALAELRRRRTSKSWLPR